MTTVTSAEIDRELLIEENERLKKEILELKKEIKKKVKR